ncbi:MAG: hypothetical protein WCC65_05465 [Pseudonocardiaceae bacterium]
MMDAVSCAEWLLTGPAGHGATCPEASIIKMRDNDQCTLNVVVCENIQVITPSRGLSSRSRPRRAVVPTDHEKR